MTGSSDEPTAGRREREKRTIRAMIGAYCRTRHGKLLCPECAELLRYAEARLDRCPFGPAKPTCAKCPVHCYKPAMREQVQKVMRYAGPRMLYRHPWLAVCHWIDSLRGGAPSNRKRE